MEPSYFSFFQKVKESLNSTMFRWNENEKEGPGSFEFLFAGIQTDDEGSRFQHYFGKLTTGLNSTMFRWNENIIKCVRKINDKFKFHYVQMKPPLLTFQTSFNKA